MSKVDVDLGDLLAKELPTDVKVTIRHVSSVPTTSAALFAAAPGEEPEPTFCENHFLSASVSPSGEDGQDGGEIIVFGMEVLVYTTSRLTTIFVSKADSTGHLNLLKAPPKSSLLRRISNVFLSFLVQTHQRTGVRVVVSLFARSQSQYLFPGSIENAEKHVLDDRGLIKWWCRAIDPILREYEPELSLLNNSSQDQPGSGVGRVNESAQSSATAYLIVPGCDRFGTRGFFPATFRSDDKDRPRWVNSYPVQQLCSNPGAPPRCLVPRLPDDPKTRFLIDLDDELPDQTETEGEGASSGQWRSVKSLDQFWEMMSFRQECSAGRLVGFIWLVINPPGVLNTAPMVSRGSASKERHDAPEPGGGPTASRQRNVVSDATGEAEPEHVPASSHPPNTTHQDALVPSSDAPKGDSPAPISLPVDTSKTQKNDGSAFSWPQAGRGHAVLSDEDYKAAINFLLEQDFFNEEVSFASTKAWNEKVSSLADQLWVGQLVTGKNTVKEATSTVPEPQTLLIRKRKKGDEGSTDPPSPQGDRINPGPTTTTTFDVPATQTPSVNVLQANLIRKKKKT